ncbi:MAG: oligosaccharide flippase family protein [Bacteroidales bacterium]|nr:oligosaccharide flippase family protein [Bacteroidales bacterium]
MKKSLLSGLFWILIANLLVKPFWILGIEVGVQNAVGTEMYGFYIGIFNITYIFNILLDLGITNFNTRNIAQYPKLIGKHLPSILGIKVLLFLLYIVITFSVGALLGYSSLQFKLLAWLTFNQFLNSLILYLRSNFEGLLLFKWDSLLSIMDRLVMIVICGLLLWAPQLSSNGFHFTIFHFVYAQTAAYVITAVTAVVVLMHKTGFRGIRFNKPFSLAIIKQSLPFALLVLLMASYNRLDPVMLQKLSPGTSGDYNAGIYAGAFRLLDALTMIAYLVSVPLLPIFSKMTKGNKSSDRKTENKELGDTVRTMFSIVMVFAVTAACTLACMNEELMGLFYNENISDYARVFKIIIFCIIPISTTYVFGTLLTAAGKLKQLNLYAAASLALNLIVNCICIPRWGAVGSAWAGLTAQIFMAVAQVVTAMYLFRMRLSAGYIIKLAVFTLFIVALTFCTPHVTWWLTLTVVGVLAIVLAMILKLIDIKEIIKTLKSKEE